MHVGVGGGICRDCKRESDEYGFCRWRRQEQHIRKETVGAVIATLKEDASTQWGVG